MDTNKQYKNIDEYIAMFPKEIQVLLEKVRQTIKKEAPEATEAISYQIPTFKWHGNLVHFAAFKNHLGFYPASKAIEVFKDDLKEYVTSKGAIQFSYSKPIPFELIRKIVRYRIVETKMKLGLE